MYVELDCSVRDDSAEPESLNEVGELKLGAGGWELGENDTAEPIPRQLRTATTSFSMSTLTPSRPSTQDQCSPSIMSAWKTSQLRTRELIILNLEEESVTLWQPWKDF